MFKVKQVSNVKLNNPILIEGLPGIGNVGKIAVDFLVDNLNTKKIYEINSYSFPHSVFVNEENLVDLPSIGIYYKKGKQNDLLFLTGDVQPVDERACYEFCEKILEISEKHKVKEIITTGGIGMPKIPKEPKVYCTANDQRIINKYKSQKLDCNIFGVVGPIIGVSGLLIGLAKHKNIPAIALLAQTYGHPAYLGIKGAREILKIISQKLNLKLNLSQLEAEIPDIEKDIRFKIELPRKKGDASNNYIG